MEPDGAGEEAIDPRLGVVESAPGDPGEPHGITPDRLSIGQVVVRGAFETAAASIDPHLAVPVNKKVGDATLPGKSVKGAQPDHLGLEARPFAHHPAVPKLHRPSRHEVGNRVVIGSLTCPDLIVHAGVARQRRDVTRPSIGRAVRRLRCAALLRPASARSPVASLGSCPVGSSAAERPHRRAATAPRSGTASSLRAARTSCSASR